MALALRLHQVYSRESGAGVIEDEAITTHDWRPNMIDQVDVHRTAAQALEGDLDAYNAALHPWRRAVYRLIEYRWYRIDPSTGLAGEPFLVVPKSQPGTNTTSPQLPPQIALSVTERTTVRKRWGRFYIPGLVTATMDNYGRPTSGILTTVADAVDALYTQAKTENLIPCVLSAPPVGGGARATHDVTLIQVDDVFDVIRRRRFENTTLRVQRAF